MKFRERLACILNMSTAVPFRFLHNSFTCFYCTNKFFDFDELKTHTLAEHPKCDVKCESMKNYKKESNIKLKIDISELSCKLCPQPMTDFDAFLQHLITNHNEKVNKSLKDGFDPFRIIKDKILCPICSEEFRYLPILVKHINMKHSNNKFMCNVCGRGFSTRSRLSGHLIYSHSETKECEICSEKFRNQEGLTRHKAKIHGKYYIKCPQCLEMFPSQYQKERHLLVVHNTGHQCNYCGKLFTRNAFMKDHIRRFHFKEKNVECSICFERFFSTQRLKVHMVKHIGERNFHCDICGKKFLWKKNLTGHIASHNKQNSNR